MLKRQNRCLIILLVLGVSLLPNHPGSGETRSPLFQAPTSVDIKGFDLLSPQSGWVLAGQSLYWTDNSGDTWTEITPPVIGNPEILSVTFVDERLGWAIYQEVAEDGRNTFVLAHTFTGGRRWSLLNLHLFSSGDIDSFPKAGFLHFINRNNGWLVLQSPSSSNFNNGVLFKTDNGGISWERQEIPVGEPVYFINPEVGWTSGGTAGQELYRSTDGGETWQLQNLINLPHVVGYSYRYQNPVFSSSQKGFLPVVVNDGSHTSLRVYFTEDGGVSWEFNRISQNIQDIDPTIDLPFSALNEDKAVLVHPYSGDTYRVEHSQEISIFASNLPSISSLLQLDMVSPTTGWARQITGNCDLEPVSPVITGTPETKSCSSTQLLLRTQDSGNSWESLSLPRKVIDYSDLTILPVEPVLVNETQPAQLVVNPGKRTFLTTGQGFDKCEIPTPDKLQAWIRNGPYSAVNLYIGGAARSCSNLALSATYISQLSQQGWKFIPTWVGPQASCYSRPIARMSSDPVVSRQQGITEANAALDKAFDLGLTLADRTGTVIYYDLENYDITNTPCHESAKAFIEGWSSQVRARGSIAGVYSLGPILNAYYSLPEKPDVIWPAHWHLPYEYDPDATVWDVYMLSNSFWSSRERIRQYAGGHTETWGGISITIDSNVLDGLTASGPLMEDADNNGNADLYTVQKSGSQSGHSEIYILDGSTNFGSILRHQLSALPWTNDQWVFDMADYDNDGRPDLYTFHHFGTSSGSTEIHILSGASDYQSFLMSTTTSLPQSTPGSWVYQLGNFDQDGIPDLYAVDRAGHSVVQVSVLSGASGYQASLGSYLTPIGNSGTSGAWAYAISDYDQDYVSDLVVINKAMGSGAMTEISVLNGAANFQTYLFNEPTGLLKTGTDNSWVFFLRDHNRDEIPDLFAVNKIGGIQGKTAVHILDGAAQFITFLLSAPSALPLTGSDCNWDFLTGQCYTSNPNILYKYYFPLAYR
ncbi:MAG: hypothetical protein A2Z16_16755 [Chloroflexi bacterium RBG_16_54_18]|nr:MAG: hypothetical protein A2Z16_16755 [Chloroflexi bacterium RBG_16_54_18]